MLIYAVCGAGIGTSVLLKANAERALSMLGIEAEVKAVSLEDARGTNQMAQVILATPELVEKLPLQHRQGPQTRQLSSASATKHQAARATSTTFST